MKKIIGTLLLALILTGCGSTSDEDIKTNARFTGGSDIGGADIIEDGETGCKYLFTKHGYAGGLSPLYNENGEIDCGGE